MEEHLDYGVVETRDEQQQDKSGSSFLSNLFADKEEIIEELVTEEVTEEPANEEIVEKETVNKEIINNEGTKVTVHVTTETPAKVETQKPKQPRQPRQPKQPGQQSQPRQSGATPRAAASKILTPEQIKALTEENKTLMAELKAERKSRTDAERALEKLRLDQERAILTAQKAAQTEIAQTKAYSDKAIKAAHAETAKVKVEAERDRAKAKKLYDSIIDKAKKDLENAVERQKRAEKTAIEKSSQAAERSRQVASLRMELSRERIKSSGSQPETTSTVTGFGKQTAAGQQYKPQSQPQQQQHANQQHISQQDTNHQYVNQPNAYFSGGQQLAPYGSNLFGGGQDQHIMQINNLLTEIVFRLRAPQPSPSSGLSPEILALLLRQPQPAAAPSPVIPDMTALSDALKTQQEAMQAQLSAIQAQQQAKIDELVRKHQEAAAELARKQREAEDELAQKQLAIDEEIARKKKLAEEEHAQRQQQLAAEEELARKSCEAEEEARKRNPTVDEVAASLDCEIKNRGGVIPTATISISDFLKRRDIGDSQRFSSVKSVQNPAPKSENMPQPTPLPEAETVNIWDAVKENLGGEPVQPEIPVTGGGVAEDPLDDLIANLSRELTELKDALGDQERKKK